MRSDMAKVVTEAPRHGHENPNRKSAAKIHRDAFDADDHGPQRLKMSHHACRGDDCKSFSDVLGPLRKYLRKQVGRPWDKIHSELCATLDKRSVSGLHIWDHVWQFVERHCEEIDGKVYAKAHQRWTRSGLVEGLFVHPRTGILRYAKEHRFRYQPKVDADTIVLDKFTKLLRVEGIWYIIRYGVKDVYVPPVVRGTAGLNFNPIVIRSGYWTEELVETSKKQLSRTELKRHGVQNDRA